MPVAGGGRPSEISGIRSSVREPPGDGERRGGADDELQEEPVLRCREPGSRHDDRPSRETAADRRDDGPADARCTATELERPDLPTQQPAQQDRVQRVGGRVGGGDAGDADAAPGRDTPGERPVQRHLQ